MSAHVVFWGEVLNPNLMRVQPRGVPADERQLSALPSARARFLAFAAIVVGGLSGALIGWSFVDLSCHGGCGAASGAGAVIGGVGAAVGVAVVSILALRAMGEWKRIREEALLNEED